MELRKIQMVWERKLVENKGKFIGWFKYSNLTEIFIMVPIG
jgi:hypothetical protein